MAHKALRLGAAALALAGALATSGIAAADATDDYPISNRILKTPCTAEQIMAAARDVEPVYYERYMIDYNTNPPAINKAPKTASTGSSPWTTPAAANTPKTPPPTPFSRTWPGAGPTGPNCSSTTKAWPPTPS
jgi:hypothetical protein